MYSASLIAAAFVSRAIDEGGPITQMKLQKLVYFVQGYYLATHNEPLFKEEIQAWKFGPVVPLIYGEYKFYGASPISDFSFVFSNVDLCDLEKLDENAKIAIEYTWNATKAISASELSAWTHNPDSPWTEYYQVGKSGVAIELDRIKLYFKQFLYGEVAQEA